MMKEPKKQIDVNPGSVPEVPTEPKQIDRFELPKKAYSLEQKVSIDKPQESTAEADGADPHLQQPPPQGTEMKGLSSDMAVQ